MMMNGYCRCRVLVCIILLVLELIWVRGLDVGAFDHHDLKEMEPSDENNNPTKDVAAVVLAAGVLPLGEGEWEWEGEGEWEGDDSSVLSFSYYHQSCPHLEAIISNKVNEWIEKDATLAASLIRLHFHDCAVRGCDASILLNHDGSERKAKASSTLRGFEVIDDIKAEVERMCPKTVSCADILTAAARDATLAVEGPFWMVAYGRRDGRVSLAQEAAAQMALQNITQLIQFFQSKGLNILDLVVLSGSHTIGRSACGSVQHRLYDFNGSGKPDPSIHPKYLNFLRRKCRWASDYVDLDAITPKAFDNQYYKNLQKHMGLLSTDQLLISDSRTSPLVAAMASQPSSVFHSQFAASMLKLANIQDHLLNLHEAPEIRVNCNSIN